jgi:ATP-dependent DNA helicase RecG
MSDFLQTPIEFLKGVGPQRADLLKKEISIYTFEDLLEYFPFRYVDRSSYSTISESVFSENYVQLRGYITEVKEVGSGRAKRLTAKFQDKSGVIELTWFQGSSVD